MARSQSILEVNPFNFGHMSRGVFMHTFSALSILLRVTRISFSTFYGCPAPGVTWIVTRLASYSLDTELRGPGYAPLVDIIIGY